MNTSRRFVLVVSTLLLLPLRGTGQNSAVSWSAFSMGCAISSSSGTTMKTSVGQGFVGSMKGTATAFEAGFLADTLFRRTVTSVPGQEGVAINFALLQNYPNPFNPTTVVSWQLPVASSVTIVVYDLLGREVATLVNEVRPAGVHTVKLDATGLASGVYLCRMTAGQFVDTKKMVLIK
jgi:hypothetical protein